jgi:hypothetical protein
MLTLKEKEDAVYGIKQRLDSLHFLRPILVHEEEQELKYEDDPENIPDYKK